MNKVLKHYVSATSLRPLSIEFQKTGTQCIDKKYFPSNFGPFDLRILLLKKTTVYTCRWCDDFFESRPNAPLFNYFVYRYSLRSIPSIMFSQVMWELGNVSLLTFSFTLLTVASVLTLILYFAYQFCLIGWHEKKTQLELGVVKIPSKWNAHLEGHSCCMYVHQQQLIF